ncbi:MAG: DUF4292 domain-containing protein [Candidatus Aminicenantes bacterium]|nr:DUF4292 domain-containing protein [Candidatus Aminicenantes bacterium]
MVKRCLGPGAALWLAMVLILAGCGRRYKAPQLAPPGQEGHDSVVMRFLAETAKERQKGRLVLDVDGWRARILFLNPLNRVVMDLYMENDRATLVNRGRKRYWRGDFSELIRRMWQLHLSFADLRRLLFNKAVPETLAKQPRLRVQVERDADTGLPEVLRVSDASTRLSLTVLRRRRVTGTLDSQRSLDSLEPADLEEVISRED